MTAVLLGIDIGTSGCKALLIGMGGDVVATDTVTYPLSQPRPGWTEQHPALWIEGARQAVAGALAEAGPVEIIGVGLTGQMHGLVALDRHHQVLRPAILWNDQRNGPECDQIIAASGGLEALLGEVNNRMLVGYTGGKMLWMKGHEPALFSRMVLALNPKDYLRLVLTGEVATEVSDASGTGLFDCSNRRWATGLIERIGLDPTTLPPVYESPEVSGRISATGASLFGLPEGVPVVGGGGDSVIQTLGSGIITSGELQTTIGTAGILATALDRPEPNPEGRLQVFCNVVPDKWHCMGVSLNAGGAMGWLRDTLWPDEQRSFERVQAEAEQSVPGANGLLLLPYLNGERCPYPDPEARGVLIGLTSRHQRADIVRSLMEGVVHAFRDMHGLMVPMGLDGKIIKTSGGGAQSPLWRQIQADLFGCDVVTTRGAAQGAAFGAALVAGLGVGVWTEPGEATACCLPLTRETPEPKARAALLRAHEIYRGLYPLLHESLAALGHPSLAAEH